MDKDKPIEQAITTEHAEQLEGKEEKEAKDSSWLITTLLKYVPAKITDVHMYRGMLVVFEGESAVEFPYRKHFKFCHSQMGAAMSHPQPYLHQ